MAFLVARPELLQGWPMLLFDIDRKLRSSLALLCRFTDINKAAKISAGPRCRHFPLQSFFEVGWLLVHSSAGATQASTAEGMLPCRRYLGGRS
jgi:hypothetical protein